jgi:nucleoid-associated protein YgaU
MMKMTVVLLIGALTLISCSNNIKKEADKAPLPPTLESPRPAPAPIPVATVSPMPKPEPVPAPRSAPEPEPEPAPAPEARDAGGRVYVLKQGDTFSKIAREQFGDIRYLRDLINANPGIDPNRIHPGQKINLP